MSKITENSETPLRVLFLHGLESRPSGSKARALQSAGFSVVAPDLEMGTRDWSRRNAVIRQFVFVPELWALVASFAAALLLLGAGRWGVGAAVFSLAVAWAFVRWRAIRGAAVARSFDACVSLARSALRANSIDVVVGSSWGGAVACALLADGDWSGPTVLLAPATIRAAAWSDRDPEPVVAAIVAAGAGSRVVVFHDPTDDVIPIADSELLADRAGFRLRVVNAGGHRLNGLLDSGELVAAVRELAAR